VRLVFPSRKKFPLTYLLIGLNVAVYVYTSVIGGNLLVTDYYTVILQYGQVNWYVMNGSYWQLFTSMFIHANITHLFGNMLFLLIFGFRAEELFSSEEYLPIYLASGLAGNLLTLLLGPDMVSVGASGAIFGVFGATVIYSRRAIGQSIISALLYSFFLLMISSGPEVNYAAHVGGLVIGLAIGYALALRRKPPAKYQYRFSYSPKP
jgi:rhomboid protease GluP